MRVLLLLILFAVLAAPAFAQGEVRSCGVPVSKDTSTVATGPSADFCDIYTRQLAYPAEYKKLHGQLTERQKNFSAPRKEAYDNYRRQLDAIHAKTGNNVGNQ
jgi:hypothetical protein